MQELSNYIAGSFQPAASGETLDDISSVTGERLATIPRSRSQDINDAVTTARPRRRSDGGVVHGKDVE